MCDFEKDTQTISEKVLGYSPSSSLFALGEVLEQASAGTIGFFGSVTSLSEVLLEALIGAGVLLLAS